MGFLALFVRLVHVFTFLPQSSHKGRFVLKERFFFEVDPYQKFHLVTKLALWFSGMTEPTHFQVVH